MCIRDRHNIHLRIIQDGNKLFQNFSLSMPQVLIRQGRHMGDDHFEFRIQKIRRFHNFRKPFGLFSTVIIIVCNAVILYIRIGFILTCIQKNETNRPLSQQEIQVQMCIRDRYY